MALTRKFLTALGIEDTKIDEIISAHTETVNALKEARDSYKDDAEKLAEVQKSLDKANEKLQEYEQSGDKDSWKVKYDALVEDKKKLQKDFDDYKADISAKEVLAKKKDAYKQLLKDSGISDKRLDAVMRVSEFDKIELDENGKIKDSGKLSEEIKSEWADFIVQKEARGADVSNPAANNRGSGAKPALSRAAQRAAEHYASLYGSATKEE